MLVYNNKNVKEIPVKSRVFKAEAIFWRELGLGADNRRGIPCFFKVAVCDG
jgi:hypothetical protein